MKIDELKYIHGHELAELKATHRVLLHETLKPLVQDAIDALSIEPIAVSCALRRLNRVLRTIEDTK